MVLIDRMTGKRVMPTRAISDRPRIQTSSFWSVNYGRWFPCWPSALLLGGSAGAPRRKKTNTPDIRKHLLHVLSSPGWMLSLDN